ncbi:MAG: Crp/Fnr family transcriptional regulator [Kiloniellales bacterium]
MRTPDRLDAKAILAEHFLLRHLPAEELDELVRYVRVQTHDKGDFILRKWTPGSGMMAVISGRVKICSVSADGKEIVLNIVQPGEILGEVALLDEGHRSADAIALEPTELLVLERREFLPFLERHPRTCIKLLKVMCHRLRNTDELIEDTLFLNMEARLAKRLLHLAELYGRGRPPGAIPVTLKLSQREIAALVGVTRERVNKQLRAWQRQNWITLKPGAITITDPEALASLAKPAY